MSRVRPSPLGREPASRSTREIPSVVDLVLDPELAPLALLDAAAHVLIQALVAANPELLQRGDRTASALEPMTVAAHHVVSACRALHDALDVYRACLGEARLGDDEAGDDFPF
jgi:hypothetical protein